MEQSAVANFSLCRLHTSCARSHRHFEMKHQNSSIAKYIYDRPEKSVDAYTRNVPGNHRNILYIAFRQQFY